MSTAAGLAVGGVAVGTSHASAQAGPAERGRDSSVARDRRGMPEGSLETAPSAGREVRAFFGTLTEGSELSPSGRAAVGEGRWTIASIHDLRHGAIPVVLADTEGTRFQVDVLLRDETGDAGVASAHDVALYLSNRGDGSKGTLEEHGLGVMALAEALRAEDVRSPAPGGLTTFNERRRLHPLGAFTAR